jgi:hypothetical protein
VSIVVTGVPRADPNDEAEQVQTASSNGTLSSPDEVEPAAGGPPLSHSQPTPTYARIVISNGSEGGDPGQIAQTWWSIEEGVLVLRDGDDKIITSRAMLAGDDPAVLARALLREAEAPKDFDRPIHYPKLGFA